MQILTTVLWTYLSIGLLLTAMSMMAYNSEHMPTQLRLQLQMTMEQRGVLNVVLLMIIMSPITMVLGKPKR